MRGFQRGDYLYAHNNQMLYLRLTLGALAEICSRLEIEDIAQLSARIRKADDKVISFIFKALCRAAHGDNADVFGIKGAKAMSALADVFGAAFEPLNAGESR